MVTLEFNKGITYPRLNVIGNLAVHGDNSWSGDCCVGVHLQN